MNREFAIQKASWLINRGARSRTALAHKLQAYTTDPEEIDRLLGWLTLDGQARMSGISEGRVTGNDLPRTSPVAFESATTLEDAKKKSKKN